MPYKTVLKSGDLAEIERLGELGWKPGPIAAKLGRNPSTVRWRMILFGLYSPSYNKPVTFRSGKPIKPFVPEEDAHIEELRVKGLKLRDIARAITETFGHPRSYHTVRCRLITLASMREAPARRPDEGLRR